MVQLDMLKVSSEVGKSDVIEKLLVLTDRVAMAAQKQCCCYLTSCCLLVPSCGKIAVHQALYTNPPLFCFEVS